VADRDDQVDGPASRDNNVARTATPISITRKSDPNLVVASVTSPPAAGRPGQSIPLGWRVTNTGPGVARGPWVDRVYLATTGTLAGATLLATVERAGNLLPGAGYDVATDAILPGVADGAYQLLVI